MVSARTSDVPRTRSAIYLRRAQELLRAVDWGTVQGLPNVVAVNSVQASISAVDAFLVQELGQRSTGTDHHEVLNLVASSDSPRRREVAQHLQRVLDRKNEVEYQDREVTLRDGIELSKHAHRLVDIVQRQLQS